MNILQKKLLREERCFESFEITENWLRFEFFPASYRDTNIKNSVSLIVSACPALNGRPTVIQDFEIWIDLFARTRSGKLNKKVLCFDISNLKLIKLLKKVIKKEGHISIRNHFHLSKNNFMPFHFHEISPPIF